VVGILDRFQETLIAPDAAAVLGWTGALTGDADREADVRHRREDLFDHDLVFPAIAEVVLIGEPRLLAGAIRLSFTLLSLLIASSGNSRSGTPKLVPPTLNWWR